MSRIFVAGTDSRKKTDIIQGLQELYRQGQSSYEASEYPEGESIQEGDLVILVPEFDSGEGRDGRAPWQELLRLTGLLERIRCEKPEAVLLLSDTAVYGKIFGISHCLKEDEMGYVCHTDEKDAAVQCMRTMENLCFRLARTERFPVKIARSSGGGLRQAGAQLLKLLQKGASGEVYNLPDDQHEQAGSQKREPRGESRSPLSPLPIVPDTGKAGML